MHSLYACPHGVFAAVDALSYIAIAVETDIQWRALAAILDLGETAWDTSERLANRDAIHHAIAAWTATMSASDIETTLQSHGVPAHQVLWPSQLYQDPQLIHREFFQELDHPEIGKAHYDGHVTQFSRTPPELRACGPLLGQHSSEIRERFSRG